MDLVYNHILDFYTEAPKIRRVAEYWYIRTYTGTTMIIKRAYMVKEMYLRIIKNRLTLNILWVDVDEILKKNNHLKQ